MSGRAGLRELVMLEGEEPERFARRVLDDLIDADVIHEVLGGLLIPAELQDHEWTPEIAAETARHLRKCHAAEEKARINAHILGYLQDFYSRAMGLLVISRTASGRARLEEARVRTIASGNGAN